MVDQIAITHLKSNDPILASVINQITLPEWKAPKNYFNRLIESIISQQLSVKAADTIAARFYILVGEVTPENVLALETEKIRSVGISYSKISYIKDLAEKVQSKKINLDTLEQLENDEIINELILVKGIGKWTAEMFLMFTLGRPDVFSYGDLGLKNAIKKLYRLRTHPSEKRAMQISNSWKPYRTLACRFLWASLDLK